MAIADDLLEPVVASSASVNSSEQTTESDSISEINEDTPRLVSLHCIIQGSGFVI